MHEVWLPHHAEQLLQESPDDADVAEGTSKELHLESKT